MTDAYYVPIQLRIVGGGLLEDAPTANLSKAARQYLKQIGVIEPDADFTSAGLIWHHALAIGFSLAYLSQNHDGVRQDYPRIPMPATAELLNTSANLGRQLAALLDPETEVVGISPGPLREDLRGIAQLVRHDGQMGLDGDALAVTAGWGNGTSTGVMPGKGKWVERPPEPGTPSALGTRTFDIYLNDAVYWKNVPEAVWRYTLGGYQVMKKWLSYREKSVLGRNLKPDEALYVQQMARRIAAIILLGDELDGNYEAVKENTVALEQFT